MNQIECVKLPPTLPFKGDPALAGRQAKVREEAMERGWVPVDLREVKGAGPVKEGG